MNYVENIKTEKKENRGGARSGAGRKPTSETTTIAFRINVGLLDDLKEACAGKPNAEFIAWAKRKVAKFKKA